MLDIFRGLKSLISHSHIQIDSPVFRLHYSLTVMVLMAFSLIVTTRQYVGNPIDCVHTKDIPEDVLNSKIIPQIPLGRLGKPEEVAGLCAYLASNEAAFITGANIAINGGQHMS